MKRRTQGDPRIRSGRVFGLSDADGLFGPGSSRLDGEGELMSVSRGSRGLLAALLIASAGLFVIGISLEKSAKSDEIASVGGEASESGESGHSEAEEAEEGHSEEGEEAGAEDSHSDDEETVLGIDIEQPLFVAAGVIVSLVFAVLALRSDSRWMLVVIVLFALAFALLDTKELFHQLDEDKAGLAVLAGVIALLHLGVAALAGREARAQN
jgi:hypothetical protein